jgi:hypothetical protein
MGESGAVASGIDPFVRSRPRIAPRTFCYVTATLYQATSI